MTGALIIVLTHLCVAPILLRPESAGLLWPRRVAWALLSGVPPSSTFWGRLLLLEALAAGNVGSTIAAVIAMASIFVASVMACSGRALPAPGRGWRGRLPELAAWLLLAVGIAIGLAPQSLTRFVFGV
jgi:formate hydrogenlyase subunit 3/multisubunit Na+/H+ antiporter MnhD subunit